MSFFLQIVMILVMFLLLGLASWHLEMREREERLTEEALETSQVLDAALEERLRELDTYRHDLAAFLHDFDIERVRAAEEQNEEQGACAGVQ